MHAVRQDAYPHQEDRLVNARIETHLTQATREIKAADNCLDAPSPDFHSAQVYALLSIARSLLAIAEIEAERGTGQ